MLFHRKKTFGEVQPKQKNKGAGKELIAKLSRGLMLPIAMLPIAGLFLGVGSAIVSNTSAYG
jgi:PTS system glucose-specific IIC component